ncbi:GntR family transcriptional regulator [Arthrobacter sp. NPDC093139]|uniref:GntR family transcriptional regulator n=1 Tax=Arthrobacter sp. NPDC093139 TaxID=3363945 RepID=UPI00381CE08C
MSSLDTRTLVDRIADALRLEVMTGQLKPGSRIRQEDVANRLGVSRTPLREALRRLQAEGWFESHPRQGIVIAGISVEEVAALGTARLALEPTAARIAAATHDEKAAVRLQWLVQEWHSKDVYLPLADFQELNTDYHLEIYGAGPEWPVTELTKLTVSVWEKFSRYRFNYWRDEQHVLLSSDEHKEITRLWLARDAEATEHAVAGHILASITDQIYTLAPDYEPAGPLRAICERYGLADQLSQRP